MVLFAPRFLETHAGNAILNDQVTAIIELVANAWDAGATKVSISWPSAESDRPFSIVDNGHGMTKDQFLRRWRTLAYDRSQEQGDTVSVPSTEGTFSRRDTFGSNGIGRHGAFAFGLRYTITTWREGEQHTYTVSRGSIAPLEIDEVAHSNRDGNGTEIRVDESVLFAQQVTANTARAEIGMRFLVDPSFEVWIDDIKVTAADVPASQLDSTTIEVPDVGPVTITLLDTRGVDRSTKHHGVAWHVKERLVGRCSWSGSGHEKFLDGRREEAKRYTFLVAADSIREAVAPDWTGFRANNEKFRLTNEAVQDYIREKLYTLTSGKRAATTLAVAKTHRAALAEMTPVSVQKWFKFVDEAQFSCPSITERELGFLAGILAELELSASGFRLLDQLHELGSTDLDALHTILAEWTLGTAKLVLDELKVRIRLVDELQRKVADKHTDEVQELQPLFHKGLWIFGPEYETIEFTSNEGMTTVVQRLFQSQSRGSKTRPDFAILPDGSAGFYSYPKYAEDGGEIGVDRLTIVELKKPGVRISTEQKGQAWKYVKELYDLGLLHSGARVTCFVLGTSIDQTEVGERTEMDRAVRIVPMTYETVLTRAKSRLHKLFERVRAAPFLNQQEINEFLNPALQETINAQESLAI